MAKRLRLILIGDPGDPDDGIPDALEAAGYSPHVHRPDSLDALREMVQRSHPPDLVLLRLPNAVAPVEEIAYEAAEKAIPVICIGARDEGRRAEYLSLGAADFVDQADTDHLVQVIERELRRLTLSRESGKIKASYAELETRYHRLLNEFDSPLAYLHDGIHVFANAAYHRLFNLSEDDDLASIPVMDLLPEAGQPALKALLKAQKNNETPRSMALELADGEAWMLKGAPIVFDGLPCVQITLSRPGVEHHDESASHLDNLVIFDVASGLYSRTHFINQVEQSGAESHGVVEGVRQAVILIFLDNFDEIATRSGLTVAEGVYAEVGRRIKSLLAVDELLCRYDQSTFGLLISCTDGDSLNALTGRLVDVLNGQDFQAAGTEVECRFRAGAALLGDCSAFEALTRAADAAKSEEDRTTATRIETPLASSESTVEEEPLDVQASIDANWAAQIREALRKDRFRLRFHSLFPVNGDNRKRYRVSLLMTTVHNGDIDESSFLPSARRKGLASVLDRWLLENLLDEVRRRFPGKEVPRLFVQLSDESMFSNDSNGWILDYIQRTPALMGKLVIEFELRAVANHLHDARQIIDALRPLGCQFSIKQTPDFQDPFPALAFVRPRYLTLDPELTGSANDDDDTSATVATLAERAHASGMRVIAVRVKNVNQFFRLKDLGIDFAQGPFFNEEANYEYSSSVMPG